MSITIAIPKPDNKLSNPFNALLEQAGFEYNPTDKENGIITDITKDIPDIQVIVMRTKDAISDLCDGSITFAPVGSNTLREFQIASGKIPPISTPITTQSASCTFCIAGNTEDNLIENGLQATQGRTIVTSYPNILSDLLRKNDIVSNIKTWEGNKQNTNGIPDEKIAQIVYREGGVEKKASSMNALVFDLVETGGTLRRNGFDTNTLLPMMQSTLVIAQSQNDRQRFIAKQDSADKFLQRLSMPRAQQQPEPLRYICAG